MLSFEAKREDPVNKDWPVCDPYEHDGDESTVSYCGFTPSWCEDWEEYVSSANHPVSRDHCHNYIMCYTLNKMENSLEVFLQIIMSDKEISEKRNSW